MPGGHGDTLSGEFLVVAQRQRIGGQSFGRQLARIAPRIGQCEQFVIARGQGQRNAATGIFEVETFGGFGRRFVEEVEAQIVHGTLLYGAVAAAGHGLRTQPQGQGRLPLRIGHGHIVGREAAYQCAAECEKRLKQIFSDCHSKRRLWAGLSGPGPE